MYPDQDDLRYLVAGGRLVYEVDVVGQRIEDESISLFGIDIDLNGPREPTNTSLSDSDPGRRGSVEVWEVVAESGRCNTMLDGRSRRQHWLCPVGYPQADARCSVRQLASR